MRRPPRPLAAALLTAGLAAGCTRDAAPDAGRDDAAAARALFDRSIVADLEGDALAANDLMFQVAARHPDTPHGRAARVRVGGNSMGLGITSTAILAAVAIPALIDRQHRSKTHEAHNNLRLMMLSAQDFYRAERVGPDGKPLTPRFPLTTSPTPPRPFCEDGDDGFVPRPEDWQQPGWRELDFAVEGPHRYRYEFVSQGEGPDAIFTARVLGDLDCDGVLSTFERSGYIDQRGGIETGTGPFIQDELE